jgi:hypothetical protein
MGSRKVQLADTKVHEAGFLRSMSCQSMGVKMSCIASGILLKRQSSMSRRAPGSEPDFSPQEYTTSRFRVT